ncbi:MAG TPA: Yip1 family protein [Gaiellaceae bacterium]|jgi:hypothetical protein|nr:Yip1 family protein [Gaiellaceae bacterium]
MRDWWLRTLLVLQRPKPVFVALRDDSKESIDSRSEPVLAIVMLAGIAAVLSTHKAGTLMDDTEFDGLLVAIWAFIGGSIYGFIAYYVFGAALYWSGKWLGSQGTYRRARHVLAFAAMPIALSLVLWPIKLAVWGEDVFRTGGSDHGGGIAVFNVLQFAFFVWSAALLLIGVRAVHGWTWQRAAVPTAITIAVPLVIALVSGA